MHRHVGEQLALEHHDKRQEFIIHSADEQESEQAERGDEAAVRRESAACGKGRDREFRRTHATHIHTQVQGEHAEAGR